MNDDTTKSNGKPIDGLAFAINRFLLGQSDFSVPPLGFVPVGSALKTSAVAPAKIPQSSAVDPTKIPQTIPELGELLSYTYDLSTTAAGKLSIPVIGSGAGGVERRVVVFEWAQYKPLYDGEVEYRYGFVIRFCLTVSKWNVSAKLTLPFLAAEAELGNIHASWLMQVRGLAGTPISDVILPPQDLKVETFVIAQQSLKAAIVAIKDPGTKFVPGTVIGKIDPTTPEIEYWLDAVKTFALSCIKRGRTLDNAHIRLGSPDVAALGTITDVYNSFGIGAPNVSPSSNARAQAAQFLQEIEADV